MGNSHCWRILSSPKALSAALLPVRCVLTLPLSWLLFPNFPVFPGFYFWALCPDTRELAMLGFLGCHWSHQTRTLGKGGRKSESSFAPAWVFLKSLNCF